MNFKWMKQAAFLAAVVGIFSLLQAADWTVTGSQSPANSYRAPNLKSVQSFVNANPAGSTSGGSTGSMDASLQQFSASVVHDYSTSASGTPSPVVTLAGAAKPSKSALGIPSSFKTAMMAAHDVSGSATPSSFPCPPSYTKSAYFADFYCEQDTPMQTAPMMLATSVMMDPSGRPLSFTGSFGGSDVPLTYGFILQRMESTKQGAVLYMGQYDNYFLARKQDAMTLATSECHAGLPVTYVGPSGPIDPTTGTPSGGYQVQVVDFIPGSTPDASVSANLSPIPPGDSNFCLTLPPNNN
jgi:hypothetical protein